MTKAEDEVSRADDWVRTELEILQFDFEQRQKEILVRSRWENYNFVLVATSLAAIGGIYLALRSAPAPTPAVLEAVAAIGALILAVLPINLAHVSSSTELRRHYLQSRVEPRMRELLAPHQSDPTSPTLTFESFDRLEHRGLYNVMLLSRSVFTLLPSLILLGAFILQFVAARAAARPIEWTDFLNIACAVLAVIICVLAYVTLGVMYSRTKAVQAAHPDSALGDRWRIPRELRREGASPDASPGEAATDAVATE